MNKDVRIALDAMGGDHGPSVVVPAAAIALERRPDIDFILFGDENGDRAASRRRIPRWRRKSRVVHCDVAVKMTDKPSQALRVGRRASSMWLAIEAVKKGEADCAVSAGNTGALMAMAKVCLRTMAADRPPGDRGDVADAARRIDRARRRRDDRRRRAAPRRSRDHGRGDGAHRVRHRQPDRRSAQCRRRGDQGHRGGQGRRPRPARDGPADTCAITASSRATISARARSTSFVTEGFTGNIALKTAEGTAKQIGQYMRDAIEPQLDVAHRLFRSRATAFARCATRWTPARVNGGVFLGLDGVVIKSSWRRGRRELRRRHRGRLRHGAPGIARQNSRNDRPGQRGARPGRAAAVRETMRLREPSAFMTSDNPSLRRARRRRRVCPRASSPTPSSATKVDTTDEWIVQRTGIRQRYIAAEGETTSTLARRGRRGGAAPTRGLRRRRHRSHHRRHLDAGLHLSGGRDPGPGRSRHHRTASPSICRRSAPASSSRWRRRTSFCFPARTSARW